MTVEENKAFIRSYLAAISGQDKTPSVLDPFIAESDEELKQHLITMDASFPRYELIPEDMLAEGDKVMVRLTGRLTAKDDFMGLPATGKHANVPAMVVYRIENGKIAQHWLLVDSMSMMQQLGAPSAA